jgi:integrase
MKANFFLLNKYKHLTSIQAIIRHNKKRYVVSIGESVLTKYWNPNTHRCRISKDYPDAPFINQRLDQWLNLLTDIFNHFDILITPTPDMIKNAIQQKKQQLNNNTYDINPQLFIPWATQFTSETSRSPLTKKKYITTINKLNQYQTAINKQLRFADIDIHFYNHFKAWLLTKNYAKNYIGSLFKNIKTFMNQAQISGIHNFESHNHPDFKAEREDADAIYLNPSEIQQIVNLQINDKLLTDNGYDPRPQNLKRAVIALMEERDRFLIGYYTALRYSDYNNLQTLNIQNNIISLWTKKNDKKITIPIHHQLLKILENRNFQLPAPVSVQKHNLAIKELAKLAQINTPVMITQTSGGNRKAITRPKYQLVSSHTARRSGATNMYIAGVDLKAIQNILGHASIEQTLKYIKITGEDNAKRLLNHPYFSGKT